MFSGYVLLAVYILVSLSVYTIARKLGHEYAWFSFIPLANLWLMVDLADRPIWWIVLLFIPYVGIVAYAIIWMAIADNLNKNQWIGLLMLIPLVNLGVVYYLAYVDEKPKPRIY